MGIGLQGAYGVAGGQQELEKLLAQRAAERMYADKLKQQAFENERASARDALQSRQLDQNDQYRRDTLAETTRQHDMSDADRKVGLANTLADQLPSGQFMPPTDPAVGFLRSGGRGSLLTEQQERPAVDVGPLQPGDTGAARAQGFIKSASAKQLQDAALQRDKEADNTRADAAAQETERYHTGMLNKPTGQSQSYQLQPEIDPKTGQQTGRFLGFNTKANRFEPVGGETPTATKAAPGAAQAAQAEASKHEALGSLNQLDQAIDAASGLIGPGAGRISKMEQLVGNPDPRISALGTKLLLTKMQVDHAATGTIRAGASPQLLARWDNLMSQNLTPENLKAAVQAMREILGGQAGSGQQTQAAGKPSAADLIKKYGGQ